MFIYAVLIGGAIVAAPIAGWVIYGLMAAFLLFQLYAVKTPVVDVAGLSTVANRALRTYSHFYQFPFVCRNLSAAASALLLVGIGLAAAGLFQGFWWGIALGVANVVAMNWLARSLTPPLPTLAAGERAAHEEVAAYLERQRAPDQQQATKQEPAAATDLDLDTLSAAAGEVISMLESFAEAARQDSSRGTAYLCASPIPGGNELLSAPSMTPIMHWGWFNPMGPTLSALLLIDVPGGDEQLLCSCALHPFSPFAVICGLVPSGDRAALSHALERLFAENGTPDYPLLSSLPSYVLLRPQSPVPPDELKGLFFAAAQRATLEDVDEICDLLERYKGQPWEREAPERVFGAALVGGGDTAHAAPPSREQFDRWWGLVTDGGHVAAEVAQLGAAWEGAIRFVAGDPTHFRGMRWDEASRLLRRLL